MAALAVVGAILMGCAGEDMANEAPQAKNGNKVIQTTTISLGGSAGTRALDADGKKTFAVGDQIAIYYKNTSNELQLANSAALTANDISSDGKTATIKVEMTDPKPESQLRYIYPAAMGKTDIGPAEEIGKTINYEKLSNDQDGTLETLASTCDLAVYDGNLTSNSELPGSATLKNLLAIAEFTFKDYTGQKDINSLITSLTIQMQGDNRLTINRTAAAGPIYVAMSPCSDEDISIIATDGTNSYEKTATAKSLAANTMTPVTMKMQKVVDLSKLTADYEAQDGDILTERLGTNVKISIADGAEIALRDVDIKYVSEGICKWAGITCLGNANIILMGSNTVSAASSSYLPAIQIGGTGTTLTIQGSGSLTAIGSAYASGIGTGWADGATVTGGNIIINVGTITATGGERAAGIGTGNAYSGANTCGAITITGGTVNATAGTNGAGIGTGQVNGGGANTCGAITITGGTVIATGDNGGAGIGTGHAVSNIGLTGSNTCGDISIAADVTSVTATKGSGSPNSIGKGKISLIGGTVTVSQNCGTVTIGGDATTYAAGVTASPFVYPTPSVALSAVNSTDYLGWRICSDGNAYAAAGPLPTGVTAVAKIVYLGSDNGEAAPYNHGLALALSDANSGTACKWSTSNTNVHTYNPTSSSFESESGLQYNATHNSDTYPAFKAAITYSPAAPTGCSSWFLASGYQWQKMAGAVGGYNNLSLENAAYWSSTEGSASNAWDFGSISGGWGFASKGDDYFVHACLAF